MTGLIASQTSIAAGKTHLNIASPWGIASYEPSVSGFAFYSLGVMETLVDATVDGALIPGLATDWQMSEDGLSWRFNIREGVNFHDGSPLTAAVAAAALQLAFDNPGMLKNAPISTITADQNEVVITLDKPFAALPALLTQNTTVIAAPASIDNDGAHIAAIGTGAFAVDKFTPPQGLDVKRFANYWGDKANWKPSAISLQVAPRRAHCWPRVAMPIWSSRSTLRALLAWLRLTVSIPKRPPFLE